MRYIRITDLTDAGKLKSEDPVSPSITEEDCLLYPGDLLIARSGSVGRTYLHDKSDGRYQFAGYLIRFRLDRGFVLPEYVFRMTHSDHWREWLASQSKTGTIPLPPLETQREIVAELETERALVDANRELIARMEKKIEAAIARIWGAAEPEQEPVAAEAEKMAAE